MRVRIITRDIAYFPASDFRSINHRTDLEVMWGDRPIPQGYVTVLELPSDWKPVEWQSAPSSIEVNAGTGPGVVAAPVGPHIPASLPRIDRPTEVASALPTPSAPAHSTPLTDREAEVHALTVQGLSRREIAGRLGVTMQSVSVMRKKAAYKLTRGAKAPGQPAA